MSSDDLRELAKQLLEKAARWGRTRFLPRVLGFFAEVWQRLTAHRLRSAVELLVLAALALAGAKFVALGYGRAALAYDAGLAARQLKMKGEDRVLSDLRHQAFDLGFTEAAVMPELFQLETGSSDEGDTCTVSYDFVHTVTFYGAGRLRVRVKGKVTRLEVEPQPNPLTDEKLVQ